jgi:hypothetical protein
VGILARGVSGREARRRSVSRRQWGNDATVSVKLSANAVLTLAFKGNLFDLSPAERELINDLTAVIQKYEAASAAD